MPRGRPPKKVEAIEPPEKKSKKSVVTMSSTGEILSDNAVSPPFVPVPAEPESPGKGPVVEEVAVPVVGQLAPVPHRDFGGGGKSKATKGKKRGEKEGSKEEESEFAYIDKLKAIEGTIRPSDRLVLSTGIIVLDELLGGGFKEGSFISLYSEAGLGKTTIALFISKYYCRRGMRVLFLDPEQGVDASQLEGIGVAPFMDLDQLERFGLPIPEGGHIDRHLFRYNDAITFGEIEKVMDVALGKFNLVVVDSTTAMVPTEIWEGASIESTRMGLHSQRISEFLRKYRGKCVRSGTTVLFLQQQRVTFTGKGQFMRAETKASAGNAERHFCDVSLGMERKEHKTSTSKTIFGSSQAAHSVIAKIWATKCRQSMPFVNGFITINFGKGVSNASTFIDALTYDGYVTNQGGGQYKVSMGTPETEEYIQGEDKLLQWVTSPDVTAWVLKLRSEGQLKVVRTVARDTFE